MEDDDFEEAGAVSESDRAWREQTQETNELAEELGPSDPDASA